MDFNGDLVRQKNVAAVTNPFDGVYCIDPGSGIDASTAVMVVGEDVASSGTNVGVDTVSHVEWNSTPSACPAETMEALTFLGDGNPPSFGETDEGGFDLVFADQEFTFVIP